MGWSSEVHDSRVTTAILQAKREARLRRAHKLPEPQGNSGPWPFAAVAGIVLSAVALQRDGRWQHAKSKLSQFCRQLQQRPQQVWLKTTKKASLLICFVPSLLNQPCSLRWQTKPDLTL
jgi:hypothetical protein